VKNKRQEGRIITPASFFLGMVTNYFVRPPNEMISTAV